MNQDLRPQTESLGLKNDDWKKASIQNRTHLVGNIKVELCGFQNTYKIKNTEPIPAIFLLRDCKRQDYYNRKIKFKELHYSTKYSAEIKHLP